MSVMTYMSQQGIASTFPFSVSPSLARAEEKRNILVLFHFLPSFPLPSPFSLSHSIKVFAPFPLPEAVALRALTCVSSWVRSAFQSVHTLRRPLGLQCRPLTPPCWLLLLLLLFFYFINIPLSSRGLWSGI